MVELYLHCPVRLHDVVFNYLSTVTISSDFAFTVHSKSLNKTQIVNKINPVISPERSMGTNMWSATYYVMFLHAE
jgi:hypothetical protein